MRFCPFICVILATIRTNMIVASKIDGEVGVAIFAVICGKTLFALVRKHFIYLVNISITDCDFIGKLKYIPMIVLNDVSNGDRRSGFKG